MIDLTVDEGSAELGRVARQLFAARSPLTALRELEATEVGFSTTLWREMADLDWLGLDLPVEVGGAGAGFGPVVALYEEMGRALVPSPHLPSAVIGAHALVAAGGDPGLVRSVVEGSTVVIPALIEVGGWFDVEGAELRAEPTSTGFRLDGTKSLVAYAHVADQHLVTARTAEGEVTLFLVPADAPGVRYEALANIADLPLFAVDLTQVAVGPDAVVGGLGGAGRVLGPALERAMVLRAAEVVGAGDRLLEVTVDYACEREQFGHPIGHFQAVQHLCSDIAIDVHLLRLLLRQATWHLDRHGTAPWEVAQVQAQASRVAQLMVHRAHEVFAGVAFMVEADVQLFTRRAKHWELDLGDAHHHDEQIASMLAARR